MVDLIIKLARDRLIEEGDLIRALSSICDQAYNICDKGCPVYYLNGGVPVDPKTQDCSCRRSGVRMLVYIRDHNPIKQNKKEKP